MTKTAAEEAGRVGAIWAESRDRVLGADGAMLWRVPADFRHFKATTLGGVVIMGRTTWESIGAALPDRRSVVLTRRPGWGGEGVDAVAADLPEAMERARGLAADLPEDPRDEAHRGGPRTWVIGGGSVYAQALEAGVVDELVVSVLDLEALPLARAAAADPVMAPRLDEEEWLLCGACSEEEGRWRPVSGDAAWRVEHRVRAVEGR